MAKLLPPRSNPPSEEASPRTASALPHADKRLIVDDMEAYMLGKTDAIATVGVKNLAAARQFYEEKLALEPAPTEEPSVLVYKSGKSSILVYQSEYAGSNEATAITWAVPDVESEVRALKDRGVAFEHYDFPNTSRVGDVHVSGKRHNAWMKDPDGNILSIVNT